MQYFTIINKKFNIAKEGDIGMKKQGLIAWVGQVMMAFAFFLSALKVIPISIGLIILIIGIVIMIYGHKIDRKK